MRRNIRDAGPHDSTRANWESGGFSKPPLKLDLWNLSRAAEKKKRLRRWRAGWRKGAGRVLERSGNTRGRGPIGGSNSSLTNGQKKSANRGGRVLGVGGGGWVGGGGGGGGVWGGVGGVVLGVVYARGGGMVFGGGVGLWGWGVWGCFFLLGGVEWRFG